MRSILKSDIFRLASGTALAQLITIAAIPVIARLYSPSDYGILSLYISFVSVATSIITLRYDSALIVADNRKDVVLIRVISYMVVIAMSSIITPIFYYFTESDILGFGIIPTNAVFLFIPTVIGYGMYSVDRALALRNGKISTITASSLERSLYKTATQLVLGSLKLNHYGLIVSELIGAWSGWLRLRNWKSLYLFRLKLYPPQISQLRSTVKKYRKFLQYESPSTFINQIALLYPPVLIANLHGAEALGWYAMARSIVQIPNSHIGSAVADVIQVNISRLVVSGGFNEAEFEFFKYAKRLALYGLIPLFLVVLLMPLVIGYIFGSKWEATGLVSAIIAPWIYSSLVVGSLSRVLSVYGAQEFKFIYDILALAIMALCGLFCLKASTSFYETIAIISSSSILLYIVYFFLLSGVVRRKSRVAVN